MNNKMFTIVNELLERYIGGQIFFTELDKAVKFDEELLNQLYIATHREFIQIPIITIASGEIGLAMHNLGIHVDFLVPGGLRFDPDKINLTPFKNKIQGNSIVFMDDSYFSGRTALVIKEEVERLGGEFLGSYVIYDGSKERDPNVRSLYRYYDYHDLLGRPLVKENK